MNKILLTYSSFVASCVVVIVAFITATTYIQLAVAILLYPVLVFFAYKVFPKRMWRETSKTLTAPVPTQPQERSEENAQPERMGNIGISDIDKRVFLKLIGGTGLVVFLLSLFNKKTEGLFFKSLPGQGRFSLEDMGGNKIDPAQNQPMDGFRITEIDDNIIAFYGFTDKDGAWYVMRIDTTNGSFRYSSGDSNFPGNWINRENLKYDYFSNVF